MYLFNLSPGLKLLITKIVMNKENSHVNAIWFIVTQYSTSLKTNFTRICYFTLVIKYYHKKHRLTEDCPNPATTKGYIASLVLLGIPRKHFWLINKFVCVLYLKLQNAAKYGKKQKCYCQSTVCRLSLYRQQALPSTTTILLEKQTCIGNPDILAILMSKKPHSSLNSF